MRLLGEVLPTEGGPIYLRRFDPLIVDEAHNAGPRQVPNRFLKAIEDLEREPDRLTQWLANASGNAQNRLGAVRTELQQRRDTLRAL